MTSDLFPSAADMATICGYVADFLVWGLAFAIVFWTLGYCVWFIIQFFR